MHSLGLENILEAVEEIEDLNLLSLQLSHMHTQPSHEELEAERVQFGDLLTAAEWCAWCKWECSIVAIVHIIDEDRSMKTLCDFLLRGCKFTRHITECVQKTLQTRLTEREKSKSKHGDPNSNVLDSKRKRSRSPASS